MPTYAVLGGTGLIGSSLLEQLSSEPDVKLHVYARSSKKLIDAHPFLGAAASPHRVFQGALSDVNVFADCMEGTSAVFGVVGTNANNPYYHIAEELATTIIAALTSLKQNAKVGGKAYNPSVVAFVTSAGMAKDRRVGAQFGPGLHWLLQRVGKYIYADFERAMSHFEAPENTWIPVIYVAAPGITAGPSMGKPKIGQDIFKDAPQYVTYTDLATGMIQAIRDGDQWIGKEISVKGAKQPHVEFSVMMYYFFSGMICVWAPPLWRFGYRRGWWGHK